MDWNRVVGRNVRRLRLARKLTQEGLAGEADLAMRHLGRIERGTSSPTAAILGRLAEAMGVEPAEFFSVEMAKGDGATLRDIGAARPR